MMKLNNLFRNSLSGLALVGLVGCGDAERTARGTSGVTDVTNELLVGPAKG